MIDIYTNGTQTTVKKIKQFIASPTGIFLYAFITGAIGIIILLAFLAMVLSLSALPMALPAIIAFNGAASGYSLTDKGNTVTMQKISLAMVALLLTFTGCVAIVFFCPWEPLFDVRRYGISAGATLICTFFGAWIACKSNILNRTS